MKLHAVSVLVILAFTSDAAAQHLHHPARQAKEERRGVIEQRNAEPVETVVEYMYVTVDENGIAYEDAETSALSSVSVSSVQDYQVQASTTSKYVASKVSSTSTPVSVLVSTSVSTSTSASASLSYAVKSTTSSDSTTGINVAYDNSLDCSEFPSAFGALSLDYLGNGGWSGIQLNGGDSSSCTEGGLCSYACPPGYGKSQWPETQPASGESHGGLLCSGGKLILTRSAVPTLCIPGQGSAMLVNKMSSNNVAVCRTDYPGTENMVVPTNPGPGTTKPLFVVIEDDYYNWEGKETSAQYYVNKGGVSQEDGCIWGTLSAEVGNFAPLVFGAGYKDGMTWLSMFPNPEANGCDAGYDVEIVATEGSTISQSCVYKNGVFSPTGGCTVAVTSGSAQYVFTDR